jgi:hypothetical protein
MRGRVRAGRRLFCHRSGRGAGVVIDVGRVVAVRLAVVIRHRVLVRLAVVIRCRVLVDCRLFGGRLRSLRLLDLRVTAGG